MDLESDRPAQPLKVMHLASGDLWAGAEVQIYTLCKYLDKLELAKVHVVLLNDGELAKRLRDLSINVYILDENALNFINLVLRLRTLLLQIRPNILHSHRQKENIVGSIANLLSMNTVSLRTQHGAPEFTHTRFELKKRFQTYLDRLCGRLLQKKVVAVSEELGLKLQSYFQPSHIKVIENGVDEPLLINVSGNAPFRVNNFDSLHVGIVGRIVPVKRIDLFLEMVKYFYDMSSIKKAVVFHVIGDGPLISEMQDYARRLGIADKVTFHGHINNCDAYIKSLDVLMMTSDHEGLPMTLLEALVMRRPIISKNAGALLPLFERRVGGCLADGHSAQDYAVCLDDFLAQRTVINPVDWMNFPFLAEKNCERMLNLYRELITPTDLELVK